MSRFTLSPQTIIRPEPHGALLFQQESAETALLDLEGLETLYFLIKGELGDYPLFFVRYLSEKQFVIPSSSNSDQALERVEEVLDKAPQTEAPRRSLSAPETIHFAVTSRCDQACEGCFYSARPGSEVAAQDAPWSLVEQVLGEAGRARVFQVALGGGEPLLHPRILDIVHLAREHNLVPNLTTNGNLLSHELALAFKEAGVGQVQISLNGPDEETNRRTRPNFAAAMRAIENCRAAGLRFGINFLLTRNSLPEVVRMIELSRSLRAASVNILRPKPPVAAADDGWLERESPDTEGYRAIRRILSQLRDRDSPTRITLDASLTFLLTEGSPEQLYRSGIWGCSGARRFATIAQDGAVYPCSHVRWSDVGGGELIRAWWESKVFARFRAQEEELRGHCRGCPYLGVCRGCRAVVMESGGEFEDSDPHCPRGSAYHKEI